MRTVVFPSPYGRARTVGVPCCPLGAVAAADILEDLAELGVTVALRRLCSTVHVYPVGAVSTAQEVEALRALAAVTDARLVWHREVAA